MGDVHSGILEDDPARKILDCHPADFHYETLKEKQNVVEEKVLFREYLSTLIVNPSNLQSFIISNIN
ncbi:hypothetical protein O9G_003318 [Rozella allomycis CSF55]|uniref:Uncharacterized protein n=1 Tax=Rozella allomycis (strain CSF55) TaxID=988480 RepID=A0A075B4L4_ROZAC|nr:hypothetical protein O9G_003318 [Rozella allomycis CSF55]|eukprot:EPZ36447.1 hypothetical protein O9G_003318 [Rozella allomycis CSF55]